MQKAQRFCSVWPVSISVMPCNYPVLQATELSNFHLTSAALYWKFLGNPKDPCKFEVPVSQWIQSTGHCFIDYLLSQTLSPQSKRKFWIVIQVRGHFCAYLFTCNCLWWMVVHILSIVDLVHRHLSCPPCSFKAWAITISIIPVLF